MQLLFGSVLALGTLFLLAFGCIAAGFIALGVVSLFPAMLITIGLSLILFVIGPWITDVILKWQYRILWLGEDEFLKLDPAGYALLSTLCKTYSIKMPKIGIITDRNPTAFTYGCFRNDARIVVSEGIYEFLKPEQSNAVLAHEFGHIKHYDFALMAAANLLVMLMYQMYAALRERRGSSSEKGSGGAVVVAIACYIAYRVGSYLMLFLSRTREYKADAFAAEHTSATDLANALIRIAYGIVAVEDTDTTHNLMHMSRSLGAIDVNNAHTYGVIAAQGQHSMATMAKAMVFDRLSPWATLLELSSTHPLTGKRIATLARLAEGFGQPFPDFAHHQAEAEKEINRRRLWDIFMRDLVIIVLPGLVGFMCFAFTLHLFLSLGVWAVFAGLMRLIYHYPRIREDTPSLTSQELITNPYVSPIVGMPVRMEGQLIGRADAGNALSPDVMMHDKFGMLPLLYNSVYGFFGDIWAGLFKTKANINAHATAVGWYRRSLSGYVELLELKTENNTLRANPYISTLLWFGLPALGCFVMFAINPSQSMPAWDLNDWFRAIRMFL